MPTSLAKAPRPSAPNQRGIDEQFRFALGGRWDAPDAQRATGTPGRGARANRAALSSSLRVAP